MWFILALLSAILWSGVSMFDKYSVHCIFTRPSQGLFVSGVCSSVGLAFFAWSVPDELWITLLLIFAGILMQFSQYFYFHAMEGEEVGDLTAFGGAYPLLVALLAALMGNPVNQLQSFGMLIVVLSVIGLRFVAQTKHTYRGFCNLFTYVTGLAASCLIVDYATDRMSFLTSLGPYSAGLVIGGLMPILIKKEREELRKIRAVLCRKFWCFGFIEMINVIAIFCEMGALSLGHPALVTTVASTEPALVFLCVHCLALKSPENTYLKEVKRLKIKLGFVLFMSIGLGLLSQV